jgi:hypothetical protein
MLENATPHLLDIYFINFPLILRFTLTLKLTTKIVKVVLNTKITPTQKKQSKWYSKSVNRRRTDNTMAKDKANVNSCYDIIPCSFV